MYYRMIGYHTISQRLREANSENTSWFWWVYCDTLYLRGYQLTTCSANYRENSLVFHIPAKAWVVVSYQADVCTSDPRNPQRPRPRTSLSLPSCIWVWYTSAMNNIHLFRTCPSIGGNAFIKLPNSLRVDVEKQYTKTRLTIKFLIDINRRRQNAENEVQHQTELESMFQSAVSHLFSYILLR